MADEDQRDYSLDQGDALGYAMTAMFGAPHVREIQTAALDFDALFMPRFFCRTCGPTNRIVGGSEGFVCVVCQQAAAYQIMTDRGLEPGV